MYRLQLDNIPPGFSADKLSAHFSSKLAEHKQIRFQEIHLVAEPLHDGSRSVFLTFESRASLEEAAQKLFKNERIGKRELRIRVQLGLDDSHIFSRETSFVVKNLDLRVNEADIMATLDNIMKANRVYRQQMATWEEHMAKKQGQAVIKKALPHFFVLACHVFRTQNGSSKGSVLLDFNCVEAANVARKGLHDRKLDGYAAVLQVEDYQP